MSTIFLALTSEQQKAGEEAAEAWLKGVDEGRYGESWETASPLFKQTLTKTEWEKVLTTTRMPLGSSASRKIVEESPAANPKGLPPGDYMFIFYETSFNNKPGEELITLTLGNDGKWRILTYLVKPVDKKPEQK